MKYCEKCGSQLDNMSVFCDDCGTEQSSNEVQYSTQTTNTQTSTPLPSEPKQKKKGKGTLITIIVLIVCLIAVGGIGFTKGWFINSADKAPITEAIAVEENKVDSNDLLHTLVWEDNKEKIEVFKNETISGYDKTIGEVFNSSAGKEEATTTSIAYNIINWTYAEYNDNTYLLLNYNYDNSNYNVVFYKDIHDNVNIAELYIDSNKYDKESFATWADKVFVEVTPEPTIEPTEKPMAEATPEPTSAPAPSSSNVSDDEVEYIRKFLVNTEWWDGHSERAFRFDNNGDMTVIGYYGSGEGGGDLHQPYSLEKGQNDVLLNIGQNGQYRVEIFDHSSIPNQIKLTTTKGGIWEGTWYDSDDYFNYY